MDHGEHISGIMFFYTDDIRKHADKYQLEQRYASANTIAGIHSHHSSVPNSASKLEMRCVSDDDCFTTVFLGEQCVDTPQLPDLNVFQPGKYIACIMNGGI